MNRQVKSQDLMSVSRYSCSLVGIPAHISAMCGHDSDLVSLWTCMVYKIWRNLAETQAVTEIAFSLHSFIILYMMNIPYSRALSEDPSYFVPSLRTYYILFKIKIERK